MPVSGVSDPRVRVGVVTQRPHIPQAKETASTRDGERNYNPVPPGEVFHLFSYFYNLTHELMSEDIAGTHSRDHAVVKMEIRAADCGQGHLDYRVSWTEDFRIFDPTHPNVVLAFPN